MKKVIYFLIFLVVIGSLYYYFVRLPKVNECKDTCYYHPEESGYWYYPMAPYSKKLETQEQCIDYCLKHRKKVLEERRKWEERKNNN